MLAQRQVKVREEERRRLGFDLHDDVCQELVGTGIMVESVRGRLQGIDPEASQKLARVSRHLNELGEHLRQVARELRPMLLHDLGLEDSVSSLAAGMTSAATRVTAISTTPIPRLGEDVEVAVYRIVQEAITNGSPPRRRQRDRGLLAAAEGVLRVEIRDDGRGFDVRERQRDALGLVSMEERALALSGKLQVKSTRVGNLRAPHVPAHSSRAAAGCLRPAISVRSQPTHLLDMAPARGRRAARRRRPRSSWRSRRSRTSSTPTS